MIQSKLARSVSVIGVGITKFGDMDDPDTPELKDMSLQDLATWAAKEAMADAGVKPTEIEKLVVGQVSATDGNADSISPNLGLGEFLGLRGVPSSFQSEGCATPFDCLNEAILAVASGRYDIVMCVDADSARHINAPDLPAGYRFAKNQYRELFGRDAPTGASCQDTAYGRWQGSANLGDDSARYYMRETGATAEDIDDAMNAYAIIMREQAKKNPKAYAQASWSEVAAKRGFDSAEEYLKSRFSPMMTEHLRVSTFPMLTEGAAAVILCATDIADRYRQQPIEIVDFVQYDRGLCTTACTPTMTRELAREFFEATGIAPEDIDYMQITDGTPDVLQVMEDFGYVPRGEAWKYVRDGRIASDGDKPVNTDGGHLGYGHAFGATGMATIGEVVYQMRGQAGERQIERAPKLSVMRGWGAGQSESAYLFRRNGEVDPAKAALTTPAVKPEPVVREFFEGIKAGKFMARKCPVCGAVEFPAYPTCNSCGSLETEWLELSGEVTVNEIFKVGDAFTMPDMAQYAPLFTADVTLAEGPSTTCYIFGVDYSNFEELRDSVPHKGRLVKLPKGKFDTWAVGLGDAVPVAKETNSGSAAFEALRNGHLNEKE